MIRNIKSYTNSRIEEFDLQPGRMLAGRYIVEDLLGKGWEGEVYRVVEETTGIYRAAKIFYPHRNTDDKNVRFYATKLHRLRKCDIVIQYHHSVPIRFRGHELTCLISELVEGELLSTFMKRQPGQRLGIFEALHILHQMTVGLEQIHRHNEYHGDLHAENVLIQRLGISFDLKIVDFYHYGPSSRTFLKNDIVDLIRLFYDMIGGQKRYPQHPPVIKAICLGMRSDLIMQRFSTLTKLREHLESFEWSS